MSATPDTTDYASLAYDRKQIINELGEMCKSYEATIDDLERERDLANGGKQFEQERADGLASELIELEAQIEAVKTLPTYICTFGGMTETVDEPDRGLYVQLRQLKTALKDSEGK